MDTGNLSDNGAATVAAKLSTVLADTYLLTLKTQGYHWNVTGPGFHSLHAMFGEQYAELFQAADEIAERIRALGHKAPASYAAYARLSGIREDDGIEEAGEMVRMLAGDHARLARSARAAMEAAAEAGDDVSADMMTGRMTAHDKAAWMLKASLA